MRKKSQSSDGSASHDDGQVRGSSDGVARIARLVVGGPAPGTVAKAQAVLLQGFDDNWPSGLKAKYALTMGGFLRADFTKLWTGGTGSDSGPDDFAALIEAAKPTVNAVLSPRVLAAAARCTQFLTLGIDLGWDEGIHAELVAIVDTSSGAIVHWTGKSFPMAAQSGRLIQVADLRSHCFDGAGERVLVLGSHDLSIFNPKARRTLGEGSPRWQRCKDLDALLLQQKPTLVLQHPHNTDSPLLWSQEWKQLTKQAPSITCWASGIAYHNRDEGDMPRRPLEDVLSGTRGPRDVVDVVINVQKTRARAPESSDEKQPRRDV